MVEEQTTSAQIVADFPARDTQDVIEAAKVVRERLGTSEIAVVLGSGLGNFVYIMEDVQELSYSEIPHMPQVSVVGHSGKLVSGKVNGQKIFCFAGRVHSYEGIPFHEVCFQVRLMAHLGCKLYVLTNASGGCGDGMYPGCLMVIRDHIKFTKMDPLNEFQFSADKLLSHKQLSTRSPWSPRVGQIAKDAAARLGLDLFEGTYCWTNGPCFETPLEVQTGKMLGASCFGMSTVPEALTASAYGMEVFGISMVTNLGAGISTEILSHTEVTTTANTRGPVFQNLLKEILSDPAILSSGSSGFTLPHPQPTHRSSTSSSSSNNNNNKKKPIKNIKEFECTQGMIEEACAFVRQNLGDAEDVAVILADGHHQDLEFLLSHRHEVYLSDIPHFPISSFTGLHGKLYSGVLPSVSYNNKRALVLVNVDCQGLSLMESTFVAMLFHKLRIKFVVTTLVAASTTTASATSEQVHPRLQPLVDAVTASAATAKTTSGDEASSRVVVVNDCINFSPINYLSLIQHAVHPGASPANEEPLLVPSRNAQYLENLPEEVIISTNSSNNNNNNNNNNHGNNELVYTGFMGPSFPTAAEIRMAQRIGSHFVGVTSLGPLYTLRYLGIDVVPVATVFSSAAAYEEDAINHDVLVSRLSKATLSILEKTITSILNNASRVLAAQAQSHKSIHTINFKPVSYHYDLSHVVLPRLPVFEQVNEAAEFVLARFAAQGLSSGIPRVALIDYNLGLRFHGRVSYVARVPLAQIPHFRVKSHKSHFVELAVARIRSNSSGSNNNNNKEQQVEVLCVLGGGACHESDSADVCDMPFLARLLGQLRVQHVITTSAFISSPRLRSTSAADVSDDGVGLLMTEEVQLGSIAVVRDHVNLTGRNPLTGKNDPRWGTRFPPMENAYDPQKAQELRAAAKGIGLNLQDANQYLTLNRALYSRAELLAAAQAFNAQGVTSVGVYDVILLRHMGLLVNSLGIVTEMANNRWSSTGNSIRIDQVALDAQKTKLEQIIVGFLQENSSSNNNNNNVEEAAAAVGVNGHPHH